MYKRQQLGGTVMKEMTNLAVEVKNFEPVCVMSKKATIEINQISTVIGSVFEEIFKNGFKPCLLYTSRCV